MFLVANLIEPRTLKGFRDYPPELMMPRERMLEKARKVFRSYGFAPIDTPALEYTEILLGKGGEESDRLIYRFKDHGDRDVALRFDLTVPFARFAAQYIGQLGTPFKRYAMGPVWRGENTSAGRYREFWQCDFDTIGTQSNAADIEIVLVIHDLMLELGLDRFRIRLNNRLLLNGLLTSLGLGDRAVPLLRSLDKLEKIGSEGVKAEMIQPFPRHAGITPEQADQVLALASITGSNAEILDRIERDFATQPQTMEGVRRLRELLAVAEHCGITEDRLRLDLSICRGLDYYTGTIYETTLLDLPKIGSVCSGGRYDNLAGLYTKQSLPGVGASLGLDRLIAALEELNVLEKMGTPASVLIANFWDQALPQYFAFAQQLRRAGIGVEVYPETKKLKAQLQYALHKGFPLMIIAGEDECRAQTVTVKNLKTQTQQTIAQPELVAVVQKELHA